MLGSLYFAVIRILYTEASSFGLGLIAGANVEGYSLWCRIRVCPSPVTGITAEVNLVSGYGHCDIDPTTLSRVRVCLDLSDLELRYYMS